MAKSGKNNGAKKSGNNAEKSGAQKPAENPVKK